MGSDTYNDLMELEFDKEIDAILRKAREPLGAAVTAVSSAHLDADAVAAFAENALPKKAKLLYMEHFADCDGCRKLLSHAILANTEADATAASSYAAESAVETAVPWYNKIFGTPNMALAMGGLVLIFSGVLGYLLIQNRNNEAVETISQMANREQTQGGPYYDPNASGAAANSNMPASNSTSSAANAPATSSIASNTASNAASAGSGTGSGAPSATQPKAGFTMDGTSAEAVKPVAAAPPPTDQPAAGADGKKTDADKAKEEAKDARLAKQGTSDRLAREAVPQTNKKTGPNRAVGPRQTQIENSMNTQSVAGIASGTRTAGGRTFVPRNGVWYDSAYHGQATVNVRRGTDEFKKLDGGLRNIANAVGSTVVVVWKNKAYRIQ